MESESKQGSKYQIVTHKENPKPESVRTQTRVRTGKSDIQITCST